MCRADNVLAFCEGSIGIRCELTLHSSSLSVLFSSFASRINLTSGSAPAVLCFPPEYIRINGSVSGSTAREGISEHEREGGKFDSQI